MLPTGSTLTVVRRRNVGSTPATSSEVLPTPAGPYR